MWIKENDILKLQRHKYILPACLLFLKNPPSIFDSWDNYLLGSIASDGCVFNNTIFFHINPEDVEFSAIQVYTLAKLGEKIHDQDTHISIGIDKGKGWGKPTTMVALSSIMLITFFERILKVKFGTNYSIPYWLFENEIAIYPWLAGLIDGDGYIWRSKDKYREKWFLDIYNGNDEPLLNLKRLINQHISPSNSRPKKVQTIL